jgi:eukaryotic-like serine/threonine-protein kinase
MDDTLLLDESLQRRGERIADRYVLADVVGIGGMGVVYSAVQSDVHSSVAIKLPRPDLVNDPYVRNRFHVEAIAGARIDHPNVVQILESGDWRGCPYLVMEHVTGQSLGQLSRELGVLPPELAIPFILQMLAGTQAMHRAGIVHGDIKTENALVFIGRDGRQTLKLIDLGLARFVDDLGSTSGDGFVTGTPEYLAPELAGGDPPSFASDQYAVCVTLYEVLAGVVPFGGPTSAAIATSHIESELVPLCVRRPDLTCAAKLDPILARGMAKRPTNRFPDVATLAAALREAVRPCVVPRVGTKAATAEMAAYATAARRRSRDSGLVLAQRDALASAMRENRVEPVVEAYFALVKALVSDGRPASAIAELEIVHDLLGGHVEQEYVNARWRVELILAALYDARGDRRHSRYLVQEARDNARMCGSTVGVLRAAAMLARFRRVRERTTKIEHHDPRR